MDWQKLIASLNKGKGGSIGFTAIGVAIGLTYSSSVAKLDSIEQRLTAIERKLGVTSISSNVATYVYR